jgi:hypothetical protein
VKIFIITATVILGLTGSIALSQDNRTSSATPVVKQIDFDVSYSGAKGDIFSFQNKFFEIVSEQIEIDSGATNRTLIDNNNIARDLAKGVESGVLTNRCIDSIAIKTTPVECEGKKIVYAVRRENGLFSLYGEDGAVILEYVDKLFWMK